MLLFVLVLALDDVLLFTSVEVLVVWLFELVVGVVTSLVSVVVAVTWPVVVAEFTFELSDVDVVELLLELSLLEEVSATVSLTVCVLAVIDDESLVLVVFVAATTALAEIRITEINRIIPK